jgi:hypothetical protein
MAALQGASPSAVAPYVKGIVPPAPWLPSSPLSHFLPPTPCPAFKGKKVCAGGLLIVEESATLTHHLTLEMLKMLVEKNGGKFQSEVNTATDYVVLGEAGARDPAWATSVKAAKLAEEQRLQLAGQRKKPLVVVPFSALRGEYEVRQHANCSRYEMGVPPPGDGRTRNTLFGTGLVWTAGSFRTGPYRGALTGHDAYPPDFSAPPPPLPRAAPAPAPAPSASASASAAAPGGGGGATPAGGAAPGAAAASTAGKPTRAAAASPAAAAAAAASPSAPPKKALKRAAAPPAAAAAAAAAEGGQAAPSAKKQRKA